MKESTEQFVKEWGEKRRKRDDGKIHGSNNLGSPDREPSPCLCCKEVKRDFCTEPCAKLIKWMERVF